MKVRRLIYVHVVRYCRAARDEVVHGRARRHTDAGITGIGQGGSPDTVRNVAHALPQLGALNFVITNALGVGVTRSLALDAHGKSLSALLLTMEIPDETDRR